MQDHEFRQFVERVKLRIPIEEAVRARVPELKRAGALWVACCPFHEERTPSFKVDPRRGTWFCYGACGTGGDVIGFVQRFDGSDFLEALELLAAEAGEPMPELGKRRGGDRRFEALYDVVERAVALYRRRLRDADGAPARAYLESRGLERATVDAFGLGWAPASGNPLIEAARGAGVPLEALIEAGLARQNDQGRAYDFFHGRLLIPICDQRGRPVGFGGRVLADDGGPKYVNTAETALFKKSRLIYGLDRALDAVRRSKHLVLVEGYTDVMAAHQVGVANTAAVLGTSTTEDHAALVRRTGARRVSLVFDGDAAGGEAARKALWGLLPLDLDVDVVTLPGGADPCDVLLRGGADPFRALLEGAQGWFDYIVGGMRALSGLALAERTDGALRLLDRIGHPVLRDARIKDLAAALELPEEGLRERWRALGGERRSSEDRARRAAGAAPRGEGRAARVAERGQARPAQPSPAERARAAEARREMLAFAEIAGACMIDNSLIPAFESWFARCEDARVAPLFEAIRELYADEDDARPIDAARVMDALGDDPARQHVVRIEELARLADSAQALARGAVRFLEQRERERALRDYVNELRTVQDEAAQEQILREVDSRLRAWTPAAPEGGGTH